MKKFLLTLSLSLVISISFGMPAKQSKIDSLVRVGVQYHDKGEYKKAIENYEKALKIDPKSTLVNYELALTYMHLEDYKNSIKYSDIVIEQKKDHVLSAYMTKGSALDNLGKTDESIKLFKKGIEEFGDHYLLYYNLGINYAKMRDLENAELAFVNAIKSNPSHASSHYGLALIEKDKNLRVQSLLSLYYFLLLEPSSKRAEAAYSLLKKQLGGNVQKDKKDTTKINIFLSSENANSEFAAVEMMIALFETYSMKKGKDKTPEELFITNTKSIFTVLGEMSEKESKEGIWWEFYIPFFYKLAKSEYIDVYCYYISGSANKNAIKWLNANEEKIEKFEKWLNEK